MSVSEAQVQAAWEAFFDNVIPEYQVPRSHIRMRGALEAAAKVREQELAAKVKETLAALEREEDYFEYLPVSRHIPRDRWPDLAVTRIPMTRKDAEKMVATDPENLVLMRRPKPFTWSAV